MNKVEQQDTKMYHTVYTTVTPNVALLSSIPNATALYQAMQPELNALNAINAILNTETYGKAESKEVQRQNLEELIFDNGGRLLHYANNINDLALKAIANCSLNDLKKLTDVNLVGKGQSILDSITANLTALAPYGFTTALKTAFQTTLTNYNTLYSQSRMVQNGGTSVKKQITERLAKLKDICERLDAAMFFLRKTQPNFYNDYLNARKVIKFPSIKRAATITVTDSQSGERIASALFTLVPVGTSLKAKTTLAKKVASKKASKKGTSVYQSLPEGEYSLAVSKAGYKDITYTITIISGETLKFDIKMEKTDAANAVMISE